MFCQNEAISHNRFGTPLTAGQSRDLCLISSPRAPITSTWSPLPTMPTFWGSAGGTPPVPVVWNTGGYEKTETLAALEGKVDVYLPDLKYLDGAVAARYSAAQTTPRRPPPPSGRWSARWGRSSWMGTVSCKGSCHPSSPAAGAAARGQGRDGLGGGALPARRSTVLLMSQYVPWGQLDQCPELNRPLRKAETRKAAEYMALLAWRIFPGADCRQPGLYP